MPEARLARARVTLPEGYQFGDALRLPVDAWAFLAAALGPYLCEGITANVIEGECLEPDDDHLWGV